MIIVMIHPTEQNWEPQWDEEEAVNTAITHHSPTTIITNITPIAIDDDVGVSSSSISTVANAGET